ncbi:MAG: tetratricopeptide repeat protein, partial [bacterium]|nr:tetratricopeptide repeat protein [bacterium]
LLLVGLVAAALAVHFPARRFGYSFNQIAMAMRYFDRAQSDPDRHDADLERSVVLLKWAGENAPGSADVHHNLGVAYDYLGLYSGAMTEFERALAIEPERRGSRIGLDGARLRLIENADRLTPDRLPQTPFEKARAVRAAGDVVTAEHDLDELLDRDPFHFLALNELAMLQTEKGQPDSAIPLLRRAVRLQPAEPVLYGNLASAYARTGREDEAVRILERCLVTNPTSDLCGKQLERLGR